MKLPAALRKLHGLVEVLHHSAQAPVSLGRTTTRQTLSHFMKPLRISSSEATAKVTSAPDYLSSAIAWPC